MHRKILIIFVLLAVLINSAPAAARPAEPTGERINLLTAGDSTTFPAGEPFHVMHGWALDPRETRPVGGFDFQLKIDGTLQDCARTMERTRSSATPLKVWRVCNYPRGMTGSHTFQGEWLGPCGWAADNGYSVACTRRNESVVLYSETLSVEFTSTP